MVEQRSQSSPDLPYADTFHLWDRYQISADPNGCLFKVATGIDFLKSVTFLIKGSILLPVDFLKTGLLISFLQAH